MYFTVWLPDEYLTLQWKCKWGKTQKQFAFIYFFDQLDKEAKVVVKTKGNPRT